MIDFVACWATTRRTSDVSESAALMIRRHGEKAGEIARNREDRASTCEGATFWLRVGREIVVLRDRQWIGASS